MVDSSHQKARLLLRNASDLDLSEADQASLQQHLSICPECRTYQQDLLLLEEKLRDLTRVHWDHQQPDIDIEKVISLAGDSPSFAVPKGMIRNLSLATLCLVLVGAYFLIADPKANFNSLHAGTPTRLPVPTEHGFGYPTSPTPSAQSSPVLSTIQNCEQIPYIVRATDTIEWIARNFGSSAQSIKVINDLEDEGLTPGQTLQIPLCNRTPSHTASTPTHTLTYVPAGGTLFSTQPE